jgi:hypothetical protein
MTDMMSKTVRRSEEAAENISSCESVLVLDLCPDLDCCAVRAVVLLLLESENRDPGIARSMLDLLQL